MPSLPPYHAPVSLLSATNVSDTFTLPPPSQKNKLHQVGANQPTVSTRERQILIFLIDGQTTKQIAQALHVKPTTIRTYLQRLYRKTHTTTRPALVWWWAHYDEGQTGKVLNGKSARKRCS